MGEQKDESAEWGMWLEFSLLLLAAGIGLVWLVAGLLS